jgi:H(+)-transporting ATP synthase subunit D
MKMGTIMAFVGRVTATRGNLLRLRTTYKFVQNAMEILKMKRDRLAGELTGLLNQLSGREELEQKLMFAFADLQVALASLGYLRVISEANSVSRMKVNSTLVSIMGVTVPRVSSIQKPRIDSIENAGLYKAAAEMQLLIDGLLKMAQIEASVERIANELRTLNRKVNALEKVVVPAYSGQIRYIEELLFDEDLEDFSRFKRIKTLAERKKHAAT